MRFLVDESTGPSVARWLREQGHQVFSIYDESRGITDAEVIQKAWQEEWILITNLQGNDRRLIRPIKSIEPIERFSSCSFPVPNRSV